MASGRQRLRVLVYEPRLGGSYAAGLAGRADLEVHLAAAPELDSPWADGPDVFFGAGVAAGTLLGLPRLRFVQWVWAGVETLLGDPAFAGALASGRLVLGRAVGVFGRPIAEYVLAYCLAVAQDIPRALAAQRGRVWKKYRPGLVRGRRLGVAGLGSVGGAIARLASLVGFEVSGLTRSGQARPQGRADKGRRGAMPGKVFGPGAILDFVRDLDYLVLALPLTPETRHIINGEVLGQMKETATLINVGRGALVDEPALVAALKAGRPGRAVLDVFETEPLPPDSDLWTLPGVIVTPHIAGLSRADDIIPLFIRNVAHFRRGEPLEGEVRPALGY